MGETDSPGPNSRSPRRRRRGPTIADVAREAGVSAMTVSRVINGEDSVIGETKDRVSAAIAALGYVPNQAARSLAGGQRCRIALIYSNPSLAYLSEFLVGGLAGAAACDAELTLEPVVAGETAAALAARLVSHRIDAALLPPPLCEDDGLLQALRDRKLAIAQIATGRPEPFAVAVTIDDEAAAHAMTRRLVALGHRRIGFIRGNADQTATNLRQAGFERALAECGIRPESCLFAAGDFTYRSGLAAAERLLDQSPRPTAIFASNDDMAAAAIAVAHRRQLNLPGDLAVCGFDDTAMATTIWPELTTIRQPVADMAREAVTLLAEQVRTHGQTGAMPRQTRLDFSLVIRDSDGPAPV